ncbi:hypothetical protein ACJIZ3_019166 [Penstemon smallii]|uniref:Uncharacterized protein n=1 Tax=Penstemon smallii TaxID=265156 RepID=A0ABD3T0E2_9LAMI
MQWLITFLLINDQVTEHFIKHTFIMQQKHFPKRTIILSDWDLAVVFSAVEHTFTHLLFICNNKRSVWRKAMDRAIFDAGRNANATEFAFFYAMLNAHSRSRLQSPVV